MIETVTIFDYYSKVCQLPNGDIINCNIMDTGGQEIFDAQNKMYYTMADPDALSQNLALARTNITRLLVGDTPRLIDEWQIAPQFWDAVRNEVDNREDDGQFILTGSAVPPKLRKDEEGNVIEEKQIHHTGTGRIARLRLRTMTLWESEDSTGTVSLGGLLETVNATIGDG